MFLKAMPFELTFADDNNQFLYFNNAHQDPDTMFGKRVRAQSGNRLGTVHGTLPDSRMKNVEWVIGVLRNGDQEYVRKQLFQEHLKVLLIPIITKQCTIQMVHMLESMKSSLTSNHGLTGTSIQLVNV